MWCVWKDESKKNKQNKTKQKQKQTNKQTKKLLDELFCLDR